MQLYVLGGEQYVVVFLQHLFNLLGGICMKIFKIVLKVLKSDLYLVHRVLRPIVI